MEFCRAEAVLPPLGLGWAPPAPAGPHGLTPLHLAALLLEPPTQRLAVALLLGRCQPGPEAWTGACTLDGLRCLHAWMCVWHVAPCWLVIAPPACPVGEPVALGHFTPPHPSLPPPLPAARLTLPSVRAGRSPRRAAAVGSPPPCRSTSTRRPCTLAASRSSSSSSRCSHQLWNKCRRRSGRPPRWRLRLPPTLRTVFSLLPPASAGAPAAAPVPGAATRLAQVGGADAGQGKACRGRG